MKLKLAILVSLLLVGGSVAGWLAIRPKPATGGSSIMVYCAAGLKAPVEAAAARYQAETGVTVNLQYGGSQTQLANIELSGQGDLYIPADASYLDIAEQKDLTAERAPIATLHPVVAVKKGNPLAIRTLADLQKPGVRIALANPEAAAVGKVAKSALQAAGQWDATQARVTVTKPTVNDVANDVQLGTADAAFVWDATVAQMPAALEAVSLPELAGQASDVSVGVLKTSKDPTAALRFFRYLTASDRGQAEFKKAGFTTAGDGDAWDASPRITLFGGSMLRPAIEETVAAFEKREGVTVTRVYNGCGILVGQMKAGGSPDAYFACDNSFMTQVKDLFLDPVEVSMNQLVILVPKENKFGIKTLSDLTRQEIRVGVGHEKQCALGALTEEMLKQSKLYEQIRRNVRVESPSGDLLVNQLLAGSLDAVVAYISNATGHAAELSAIKIDIPCALATQPMAVARESKHRQLTQRLMTAIQSRKSRSQFEAWGFRWVVGEGKSTGPGELLPSRRKVLPTTSPSR